MHKNDYDVVVVGLGTAGAIALAVAAKRGLKAIGIERLNTMGGTGTSGKISSYYYGSTGGYFEEIDSRTLKLQNYFFVKKDLFSYNAKEYILEKAVLENGGEILYDTIVTEVKTDNNRVYGVTAISNGVSRELNAKFVIDCTAECDICYMAGCETSIGRRTDGQTQPFTYSVVKTANGVTWGTNTDAGYTNHNNSKILSDGILSSLTMSTVLLDDYSAKKKDCIGVASFIGIREGRTIIGEKRMRFEDIFSSKKEENTIFYAYSNIDNHAKDTAFEDGFLKDWYVGAGLWGVNMAVAVPAEALIPEGISGIITAGRCLSVEHNIAPCIRMQRDMQKSGEAAANMVYLAIKHGVDLRNIQYKKLSNLLKETRCLDKKNNTTLTNKTKKGLQSFKWLTDKNEIKEGMSGLECGIAIWSARLIGNEIYKNLTKWLKSDNENLRINSAIALALMDKADGIDILRGLAVIRDGTMPDSTVKYVYTRGTTAIYLLGRLGDKDAIEILYEIIRSKGMFDESQFIPDELHSSPADVRFMNYSYAIAALVDIARTHPDTRADIFNFLTQTVLNTNEKMEISLKSNQSLKYDMMPKIKMYICASKIL